MLPELGHRAPPAPLAGNKEGFKGFMMHRFLHTPALFSVVATPLHFAGRALSLHQPIESPITVTLRARYSNMLHTKQVSDGHLIVIVAFPNVGSRLYMIWASQSQQPRFGQEPRQSANPCR